MTHKPCGLANHVGTMARCNMAAQTMTHNGTQAQAKNFEGEGVGPSAKGQRKRTGREQFFYFLL